MSSQKIIVAVVIGLVILIGGSYTIGAKLSGSNTKLGTNFSVTANAQPGVKEFNIVMQNNRYNPSTITVSENDRVIINFTNRDQVAHGVGIAKFNANVPGGHVRPGESARMEFFATSKGSVDAATCGGPTPTDKTDDHGEELIVNVV